MLIQMNRNGERIYVPESSTSSSLSLKNAGYSHVLYDEIPLWDELLRDYELDWLYTDGKSLFFYNQWVTHDGKDCLELVKIADVIPSTKYDLGTRTIELTDLEVFNLKTAFLKEGMKSDVEQRWDELTADGEIPEDINPDFYEILDLAETRQSGDFTYNDAYWRTIEDAIHDYIKEVQNERPE